VQVTDATGLSTVASATVHVDNVAPAAGPITAPLDPTLVNTPVNASASFTDPGTLDTHAATWDWGDGSTSAGSVSETNGSGSVTGTHTYTLPGVYELILTVTDKDGASSQSTFQYVVVYDPNGGSVTGSGWISSPAGAYIPDPSLTGKASFAFTVRYQKGAAVPKGDTAFQIQTAGLSFVATSFKWLVVTGAKFQFEGEGTLNGTGGYGFTITAVDGSPDLLRVKIEDSNGVVVYDNQPGAPDTAAPTTAIGGGNIAIHK